MALTATACQKVVEDILSQLKMKAGNLEKFKLPCFRSNLYYDVRYRDVIDDPYQVQLGALKKLKFYQSFSNYQISKKNSSQKENKKIFEKTESNHLKSK